MAALDGFVTLVTPNTSLQNYSEVQFPERRTTIPSAEQSYSPNALTISTIKSWNPIGSGITDKVYDPVDNLLIQKDVNSRVRTILDLGDSNKYRPFTPTGRDDGYVGGGGINGDGGGGVDFSGLGTEYLETADSLPYNTARHGTRKSTLGLSIGGIDTSKLPDWVKAFSIVRTAPAGRVVCQGLAMYALIPQVPEANPALFKALNKIWFYSPEMDPVIGDKSYLFDAIKTNPADYQIQLVAPVGFFTDIYSAHHVTDITSRVDMISYAIMGGNNIHSMEPTGFDTSAQIGAGSGRATFGRFRNVYPTHPQGDGLIDDALTFSIQSAIEPSIPSYENNADRSRTQYLEIGLSSNLYATSSVNKDILGNDSGARAFHEPWYIVNIIQNGRHIPNNNINSYKDIGNYIKLSSIIGKGNGEASQTFDLVDEREEDVLTLGAAAASYRYIWVDDQPWLGANNLSAGDIDTYRTALEGTGYFTPAGGLVCYGLYFYTSTVTTTGPLKTISFPYVTVPSSNIICPGLGNKVEIRYNYNSPITIFLGDTVVDDAIFAPIDTNVTRSASFVGVYLGAPMPFKNFNFLSSYVRPSYKNTPEGDTTEEIEYVRQWVVSFGCESTVNLPFMYKNYFPNRNYVIRPALYDEKPEADTEIEYLGDHNIWATRYSTDYPEEYLIWGYGGFHLPTGYNFDYEKVLHTRSFTRPTSGSEEILTFMKRLHWSAESMVGYPSSRAFLPTNVYDLRNDKASQISILYDIMSDKGNNLYVITDYGAGLVLTDKKMLTDAGGNYLSVLVGESTLVQGELWLNPSLGCPKEFWRGKTEGNVKLSNNIVVSVLVFPTYTDIVMLSGNQFVAIADNNRKAIMNKLALVDLAGTTFNTLLHSVIDETKNDLIVRIDTTSFYFNFDINNWGGSIIHRSPLSGKEVVKTLFIPWIETSDVRSVIAQINYNPSDYHRDIAFMTDIPTPVNQTPYYPYVVFSVTPILGAVYEFIDMYISATHKPYSVMVSTDEDFTTFSTILANKIKEYNTGWYYIQGLPKVVDKNLIGKTLYIKINYADHNEFYGIKVVKVGYRDIMGG